MTGHELISKKDLIRLGQQSLADLSDYPWSVFFDIFLLTSLKYFAEKQVDYIILECGIGGRFDSTNFIDAPKVAVITR